MTASQNVVLELKKLGIDLDMPPNKLKAGFGEGVCLVLSKLCQISVSNKFKFKKASIRAADDGGLGDDDGDEEGNEYEGHADVNDMPPKADDKDDDIDIDEDMDFGGGGGTKKNEEAELLQQEIMHS